MNVSLYSDHQSASYNERSLRNTISFIFLIQVEDCEAIELFLQIPYKSII